MSSSDPWDKPGQDDPAQSSALPPETPRQEGDTAPLKLSGLNAPPAPFGGAARPRPASSRPTRPDTSSGDASTRPMSGPPPAAPRFPPPQGGSGRTTVASGQPPTRPGGFPPPAGSSGRTTVASGQPPTRPGGFPPPAQPPRMPPPAYPNPTPTRPAAPPPPPTIYPAPVRPGGARPPARPVVRRPTAPPSDWRSRFGCLLRTSFIALFGLVLIALCGVSLVFVQYFRIAGTLPDIEDLRGRAAQFETMRIMDRNGDVLYDIVDPNAGRRTFVPLNRISPYLIATTIATEDAGYYSHPGFDVFAILRAFWQNYTSGTTVSGASTITQQLARNLLLSPEERNEQSYSRKLREAILAAELTRRYSKDEILEIYLNEIYYGNLAYGIEAAAQLYFNTSASQLTLGQAAFLAGLPQAPAIYDVFTNPDASLTRQRDVLRLTFEMSLENNCITVSNAPQPICVDAVAATNAASEIKAYAFTPPQTQIRYPHWVMYIRALLETQYDAQTIYKLGYTIYTTLDPELQDMAQAAVTEQVRSMAGQNAQSGALIAIRPASGEILAMVGSADFYNEAISGQVNMTISPRQPGSSIKPLTYLAAFERGWTPATLIWDVPSEFPPSGRADDLRPPYIPQNYDGTFRGPVTVRRALANSLNIPAVKALQFVGIYDDPNRPGEDGLLAFAKRMGISTFDQPDYGLSLTLGGGDVTLLDLTSAYAILANNGRRIPPIAIFRIVDHSGNVVYQYTPPVGDQVLRAEHAFLMSSILSDNVTRSESFGNNSPLTLPFPAAAKTGTTNDFRDNWTMGYTPDLAVGVWVGNPDYTQMVNTTGLSGAAPIWNQVMSAGVMQVSGGNPQGFNTPPGVVEHVICAASGTLPSQWCPKQRSELFAADQPPLPASQDLWQKSIIDTWSGLRASAACADFVDEVFTLNVQDDWARKWIRRNPAGQAWAAQMGAEPPVVFTPSKECTFSDPRPNLILAYPQDGQTIQDTQISIYALIDVVGEFDFWQLDFGQGDKPVEWETLARGQNRISQPDIIANWDVRDFPPGIYTLRLEMQARDGGFARRSVRVILMPPTATPPPTETLAPTLAPTIAPTLPPWPTETPTPPVVLPSLPPPPFPTDTPPAPTPGP